MGMKEIQQVKLYEMLMYKQLAANIILQLNYGE
ncbi:hypothetical protein BN439_0780 [Erwinia amylovora Ea644]|nr:hypothetical protein BN439_0780 [Erwinia amylovora Ea644]CCP05899.1 hypothetical protein BN440_0848 [Erwinia amylovora MR1]